MEWTEKHDVILCQQILVSEPYKDKAWTLEGGKNQNSSIKDIILLPNPNISSVPRGRKREELYVRKLVATAFEILGDMSSSEIYNSLQTEFSNHLNGNDFEIVWAVGNKIVSPNVAGGIDVGC